MNITPPAIVMDVTGGTVDIVETPTELEAAFRQSQPPLALRILDIRGIESRVEVAETQIKFRRTLGDKEEIRSLLIGLGAYYGAFDISILMKLSLGIEEMFRSYFSECRSKGCITTP